MLKRKAYKSITNWYNQNLKKCLLVDGARQIGKTYIIRKFLEENSKSFVEFNLYDDNLAKEAFEKADSANNSELTTKIDEADAALQAAIDALSAELDSVKGRTEALENKTGELQTFIIIVCVISGIALCGSGAFVLWFFIDRRKRS